MIPLCPRHEAGEDEQQKRDKEALIRNWIQDDKAIKMRNDSQDSFFDYMFAECTGWLRKRISPSYWKSLVELIKPMNPRRLYQELQRVGAITGEINSTIADNQRFAKVLKPFPPDLSIQPHEFLSRFIQASRDDYRVPLADGSVFDPTLEANWTEVEKEMSHRSFYRLLTQHRTFVNWSVPAKFDDALTKFFESPNEYRLYSQKTAAIINLYAKQDTAAIVWDGAKPKQQQFIPRQQQQNAASLVRSMPQVSSSSSNGAPQQMEQIASRSIPASIMRLTRNAYQCTTAQLDSLPEGERTQLVVNAIRSQVQNPTMNVPDLNSNEAKGQTSCNCGSYKAISD